MYTPTEWVSGTIISASKLNNIEGGVESVNSEYTPTTWAEGDTVTAAKLNKIEQGIADASGGDGDFEVVTITLINNSADKYLGINRLVWVYDDALETEGFPVEADETVEVQVVLYKGKAVMYPDPVDDTIDPIVTGDITFNSDEWYFEITGAGSIALTGAGESI